MDSFHLNNFLQRNSSHENCWFLTPKKGHFYILWAPRTFQHHCTRSSEKVKPKTTWIKCLALPVGSHSPWNSEFYSSHQWSPLLHQRAASIHKPHTELFAWLRVPLSIYLIFCTQKASVSLRGIHSIFWGLHSAPDWQIFFQKACIHTAVTHKQPYTHTADTPVNRQLHLSENKYKLLKIICGYKVYISKWNWASSQKDSLNICSYMRVCFCVCFLLYVWM